MVSEQHPEVASAAQGDLEAFKPEPMRTVNVLSIGAAIIGIVSIFFAWGTETTTPGHAGSPITLWNMMFVDPVLLYQWLLGAMFIISTIAVLCSPAADFAQVFWLTLWASYFLEFGANRGGDVVMMVSYYSLSWGYWLATASAAIAIFGIVHPTGPGLNPKTRILRSHLLTICSMNSRIENGKVIEDATQVFSSP